MFAYKIFWVSWDINCFGGVPLLFFFKSVPPYLTKGLTCCNRTFANMGALATHEHFVHGSATVHVPKKRLRKSYSLRFKAKALEALQALRSIRCVECQSIVLRGDYNEQEVDFDALTCTLCAGKEFAQKIRHMCTIADILGINKSLLSKWRSNFQKEMMPELAARRGKMKKMVYVFPSFLFFIN